jgi:release factor glutamine methyltransferase
MTLGEILKKSEEFLVRKGIENAKGDARRLLAHGLDIAPLQVLLQMDRPMAEAELVQLRTMVARRGQGEPLQHILGRWAFRHLELKVDGRALVPRPETEMIVDLALERLRGIASPRVHEVGVGTGAIGLSFKRECPQMRVSGSDLSPQALSLCSENARDLGIWLPLFQGNLAQAVASESLDLLVSNPPYIATDELAGLSTEVRHDPRLALDGGTDGLTALRSLAEQGRDRLKPGGWLIMEHGWDQGRPTRDFCVRGWEEVATIKDLGGQDRFLVARRLA